MSEIPPESYIFLYFIKFIHNLYVLFVSYIFFFLHRLPEKMYDVMYRYVSSNLYSHWLLLSPNSANFSLFKHTMRNTEF